MDGFPIYRDLSHQVILFVLSTLKQLNW